MEFAAIFVALYVGHSVGDHWVQTDAQAQGKGWRTRVGRLHCVGHVATLTLTQLAALGALVLVIDLRVGILQLAAGLAVNAATHYWADRRFTLAALCERLGKGPFYRMGTGLGTGAYALDQSWHIAWLFVAALVMAA